ncbi:MAG: hypothetical protein QNJ36_11545 [Calothrix sp. MO_167.B42]|nr:hypothetical protein [Calothrix sp. MO_167.B42]
MTLHHQIATFMLALLLAVGSLAAPAYASENFTLTPTHRDKTITGYNSVKVRSANPGAQVTIASGELLRTYRVSTGSGCKIGIPSTGERAGINYTIISNPQGNVTGLLPAPTTLTSCEQA